MYLFADVSAYSYGRVPLAELSTLLRLVGANPTDDEVAHYRQELRADGVEAVTTTVLEGVLRAHSEHHTPEQDAASMEEAWDVIDENGDGVVSGPEVTRLVTMLTTYGNPLTDEEMDAFMREMDADESGTITREEYRNVML